MKHSKKLSVFYSRCVPIVCLFLAILGNPMHVHVSQIWLTAMQNIFFHPNFVTRFSWNPHGFLQNRETPLTPTHHFITLLSLIRRCVAILFLLFHFFSIALVWCVCNYHATFAVSPFDWCVSLFRNKNTCFCFLD